MFCPKCATQNLDGASFCRSCGANISLLPQALSGQITLPAQQEDTEAGCGPFKKRRREASLENAFRNAFMGIGFLLVSIALSYTEMGMTWWFWLLIPAFSMMGTGVAQYIRFKENEKRALNFGQPARLGMPSPPPVDLFPQRRTGELAPSPPSVTEGTTRHLAAEAPTRHFDASSESAK